MAMPSSMAKRMLDIAVRAQIHALEIGSEFEQGREQVATAVMCTWLVTEENASVEPRDPSIRL